MTLAVPADNRPTAQMILHSLHHAFGRGCGALIGGAIINSYGSLIVILFVCDWFFFPKFFSLSATFNAGLQVGYRYASK